MKEGKCVICKLVTILVAIGAINWGTLAFFQLDLVTKIFGGMTTASKIVYGVIGVAGVIKLLSIFAPICPCCKEGSCKK